MNILLIDVDSKIPNLALMKISSYHKSIGNKIALTTLGQNKKNTNVPSFLKPDKIYASTIFKHNKHLIDGLKFIYPNIEIDKGGSAYSLTKQLPLNIEYIKPDYDLYENIDSSYGFTTRGCNRNCHFCIVPQKEGKFRIVQHPSKFYDNRFNKIFFFDNNILWDKNWFRIVCQFCIDNNLKVWFNQGLDIRLIDEDDVSWLLALKKTEMFEFAWDNINLEPIVEQKIQMLKDCGINTRQHVQIYVYIDNDTQFDSGLYRANKLKEWKTNAFVMYNIDKPKTKRIKDLIRWTNRKSYFWSCDFSDFSKNIQSTDKKQKLISEY